MVTILSYLVVFTIALGSACGAYLPVTVTTQNGDVTGYQTDVARIFYGIPFAQPPVNELR